jgi:DNA-binding Lrp family transcriptional regulator
VAAPPPPAFVAPGLDESDPVVRELAGGISAQSQLMEWLEADGLIRRFVVAVANVAEGRTPRDQLAPAWPVDDFEVEASEEQVLPNPASYARYDLVTDVFVSVDTERAIALYRKLEPAFDEAYAAPVLVGEPTLQKRVLTWEYADPELEGLSPAQKQLLRMGPANVPRVQKKLRAFGKALGMPTHAMPATQIYDLGRG